MKPSTLRSGLRLSVATLATLSLVAGAWWLHRSHAEPAQAAHRAPLDRGSVATAALPSHRVLGTLAPDGSVRVSPPLPSLEAALGLESKLSLELRLEVLHSLFHPGLSREQIDRLVAFIGEPRLPDGLNIRQVRGLKNDVLNVLGFQTEFLPALTPLLARWSQDPALDPAVRDYALQQLGGLDAVQRDRTAHWQAIDGSDSGLAATAMLHLLALARAHQLPEADSRRLADAALKLAGDANQPETSRTTALQVCGQLKRREARPLAYAVARSDQASIPFRIAAVATLGDLGGEPDVQAYLGQLASGSEPRLRVPAQSALKRISLN